MRWPVRVTPLFPALLLSLVPIGCGETGGPHLVPVSGRVLLDNKPLPNATVRFTPVSQPGGEMGPLSFGTTDAEGRYTLKTVVRGKDIEGAVVGKHRIEIAVVNRTVGAQAKNGAHVPSRYNRNSKLEFTVPAEGTQEANFLNLTSR
jgi:hypothetical protein